MITVTLTSTVAKIIVLSGCAFWVITAIMLGAYLGRKFPIT